MRNNKPDCVTFLLQSLERFPYFVIFGHFRVCFIHKYFGKGRNFCSYLSAMKTGSFCCVISMLVRQHIPATAQKKVFILYKVCVANWANGWEEEKSTGGFANNIRSCDARLRKNNLLMTTETWTTLLIIMYRCQDNECDQCVRFGPGRVIYNGIH